MVEAVAAVEVVVGAKTAPFDIAPLGVGIGYREPHRAGLFLQRDAVDFLEITVDHFLDAPSAKREELDLLAAHWTLIPHGLNLSLGSAEGLDDAYLKQFATLVHRVKPPYWSEHIAFTRAGGVENGHLCPLPFTREAIDVLCRNIARAQEVIGLPLILENITYSLNYPGNEMSEGEFLREVLERAECGLLLDVTNLHVNAVNHGYDPLKLLDELPLERVVQLHFVGIEEKNGQLIDSHACPTPPEVFQLMDKICARTPVRGAILERDAALPNFAALVPELETARAIFQRHGRWP